MSTLTQLLLIAVIGAVLYGAYLRDKARYDKLFAMLPDLRRLIGRDERESRHDHHNHHQDHDHDHEEAHPPHAYDDGHGAHGHQPVSSAPAAAPVPVLSSSVKIVVYVPDAHADEVRQAIGQAGGGIIGNYSFSTFSSLGTGRYLPGPGANPMVGTIGVHERVEEERIEFTCSRQNLEKVVATIRKVHPYEEIVIDIYPLEALPPAEPIHSH